MIEASADHRTPRLAQRFGPFAAQPLHSHSDNRKPSAARGWLTFSPFCLILMLIRRPRQIGSIRLARALHVSEPRTHWPGDHVIGTGRQAVQHESPLANEAVS